MAVAQEGVNHGEERDFTWNLNIMQSWWGVWAKNTNFLKIVFNPM